MDDTQSFVLFGISDKGGERKDLRVTSSGGEDQRRTGPTGRGRDRFGVPKERGGLDTAAGPFGSHVDRDVGGLVSQESEK